MALPAIVDRNRLNFSWLLKLRWSSIVGQIATILGVYWLFSIELPLPELSAVIALEFGSNIVCAVWARRAQRVGEWHVAAVMALDVLLLTGLLYFTGGPFNPFSFLYLVNISLAAIALRAHMTWMLVALSLGCFGLLFFDFRELPLEHLDSGTQSGILQKGMWVAFGVASAFIVTFLWRVTSALSQREVELGEVRRQAERQERLASLATMAAGAAHELSTPLGTIALVAKELERSLVVSAGAPEAIEDLRLIRDQVARCRVILDQMGAGSGKSGALGVEAVPLGSVLSEALSGVRSRPEVRVDLDPELAETIFQVPTRALAQALRSLITNAQDASAECEEPVLVAVSDREGGAVIEVSDRGTGMSPQLLERIGEPFFTTKAPGKGMGLGVFLGRATLEKLGGSLHIDSQPGQGTRVQVMLPRLPASSLAASSSVVSR